MPDAKPAGLFALVHAAGNAESRVDSKLSVIGLSLPKLAALHQLALAGDSLPLGQLAERLSCVKSNVTQLVDRLEADGLVERVPDAADRRSIRASLTEAGRARQKAGSTEVDRVSAGFSSEISPTDGATLERLLTALK